MGVDGSWKIVLSQLCFVWNININRLLLVTFFSTHCHAYCQKIHSFSIMQLVFISLITWALIYLSEIIYEITLATLETYMYYS